MAENTTKRTRTTNKRSRADIVAERRKIRNVSGEYRDVLSFPSGPEYAHLSFRWVLDRGDRIDRFLAKGWKVFDGDNVQVGDPRLTETNVSGLRGAIVAADKLGKETLILMCIDVESFEIDQLLKEEDLQETEAGMNRQAKELGLDAYDDLKINR